MYESVRKDVFFEGQVMKRLIYGTLAVFAAVGSLCFAAPEPAVVQGEGNWTVDVRFEHPQQIMVQVWPDKKPERFWYVIVTLTNETGKDVEFYPKCELMTDTFRITPAGKDVAEKVFDLIKKRHRSRYPFLESIERTSNKILQGRDNAKDIAIIWPDFDPGAKAIKLFISGLSNETAVVEDPVAKDENGQPLKIYLRKTLELSYKVPGDPAKRSDTKLRYEGKQWVMR
jgi:hypothetical protein